jgi:small subunit ribosomal protein S20
MANTTSAQKAARQALKRTQVNKARLSRTKSYVRKVEEALEAGNKEGAKQALAAAEPVLMRSSQKGVVHKKAAARKISRLAARVKALP